MYILNIRVIVFMPQIAFIVRCRAVIYILSSLLYYSVSITLKSMIPVVVYIHFSKQTKHALTT